MQPRSLESIIAELNSVYDPQVNLVRQQQSVIPDQLKSDESALGAQKDQAYEDIVSGARQRGLGFSGIPLGEQAKYAATQYAPALANLRKSAGERATSLEEAILGINERKNQSAQQIYQFGANLAEQQRQFNEQQALAKQQLAAQQRAAAAASAGISPSLATPSAGKTTQAAQQGTDKARASAAVLQLLGTKNKNTILSTYEAIKKSAGYGNAYDQYKLQLINSLPEFQPYLISNFAQLRF